MSQDKQPLCQCGQPMTADDAEFWGECEKCRLKLPLQSAQLGDGSGRGAGWTECMSPGCDFAALTDHIKLPPEVKAMGYTVAGLHRELAKLIEQGHGRKPVCVNKASFAHPLEQDGAVILQVAGLAVQFVPAVADDGGTLYRKDGSEAGARVCVIFGDHQNEEA